MGPVIAIILLLLGGLFVAAFFYVFGTYLLLRYDRHLARKEWITPGYVDTEPWPGQWRRRWAFVSEVLATFACLLLYPIGLLFPYPWRASTFRRHPIILVHGFKHNQATWLWMRRRLRRSGFGPIYSLNLSRRGPIQKFAQEVNRLAQTVEEETGQSRLTLIGHSMGGVVAAYYAEYLAAPGKVSHLITLGAPLQGTRSAILPSATCAKQMRPDSSFIKDLSTRISSNQFVHYRHLSTQLDNVIFPHQSAILGADPRRTRVLATHGHVSLLFSSVVAHQLVDWLKEPARVPPGARVHDETLPITA